MGNNKNNKKSTITKFSKISLIFIVFCILFLSAFLTNILHKPSLPKAPNAPANFDMSKTSNIVFTTDKKYLNYLKVAMLSAIMNKNVDSYYNIYVLGVDLAKKDIEDIESFGGNEDKVRITVVPLKSKLIKNIKSKAKYSYRVSRADLFKFFIPEIFENLDRILYLDCDILVLDDLAKVYNFDLNNKLIGAVFEKTNLPLTEEDINFNCGVILFDIKKCLENNLVKKLLIAKSKDKTNRFHTQLAYANALKIDEIKYMPSGFNYLIKDKTKENIPPQELKNITIAHYAGFKKPWHNLDMPLTNLWWNYAQKINHHWTLEKRGNCFCLNYALKDGKEEEKYDLKKFKKRYEKCTAKNEISLPKAPNAPANFDMSKTSNIVFTTDKKYLNYLKVAMLSAIMNKNVDSYYNIYVLGVDLAKKDIEDIESFGGNEDKVRITVVPLKLKMLDNVGNHRIIGRSHVSRADLFKFFIPEIFENLDRILYLDCDILVLDDLAKVYNFDLNNKLIGAVQETYRGDFFEYNCGVILFDIKKCLENKITQQLITAKNKDKQHIYITQPFFHQVLNESKVQKMPYEYNRFSSDTQKDFEDNNYKNVYYKNNKAINSIKDIDEITTIIHFLAYKKPWQYPTIQFAPLWWEYAYKLNPHWKPKKERNTLQNIFLSLELTLASHKERNFTSIKGVIENFRYNFNFITKQNPA